MRTSGMVKVIRAVFVLAAGLAGSAALAADGIWTGAGSDGKWTNPDNWQGGVIPGRTSSGGQGGDTATFGAVADGAKTTVDLSDSTGKGQGLISIGGIKVVGADAPKYLFGTGMGNDAQTLRFEADGFGYYIGADVVNAPSNNASYFQVVYAANSVPVLTVRNESTNCVVSLQSPAVTATDPRYSGSVSRTDIDFRGAGNIRLGYVYNRAYENFGWNLNQTGKLVIGCDMYSIWSKYPPVVINAGTVPALSRIEIEEGVFFRLPNAWHRQLNVWHSDVEFSGAGKLGFNWRAGYDSGSVAVRIQNGRKLTVRCAFEAISDYEESSKLAPGVRAYRGNQDATDFPGANFYGGDWLFLGPTDIRGPLQNFFGNMETDHAGGFGTGEIQLASGSILRYTGAANWTMTQNICITNWPSRTGLSGKIEAVAGKGVWTLVGGLTQHYSTDGGTGTFTLTGDGEGVVSGIISNTTAKRVVAVAKTGTGTWTLSGANTYTGATTVNEGTLIVAKGGSIASSSSVSAAGGILKFEGDDTAVATQAITKLTITANGTLALEGKTVAKAAAVSRTAGALDIITKNPDAKLVVPVGTSASCFTWNGQAVRIGADGSVTLDADAIIAARGDTVPDNNGKVAIFYDGTEGNDTLAADTTTLVKLMQIADMPSTVKIGSGQTLSVSAVSVGSTSADLTLGAAGDKGTLASATKKISFDNQNDDSTITLNVGIAAGVTNELAHGRVALRGDTKLGYTKIAIADKAKAQLDVRGCTVETGFLPVWIGANTGNNYGGGGTQYGEVTVSNALVRNVADIARAKKTYDNGYEYGIIVGMNSVGTLRVQDGAVISNKFQIGAGAGGISGADDKSTSGRGVGAVYQSGGKVATVGGAEYRQNTLGHTGMGYYELVGGAFKGSIQLGTYGIGIWNQFPSTTADLGNLNVSGGNGGQADVYVRGTMKAASGGSQLCGGYQDNKNLAVTTVDGPGLIDFDSCLAYAFVSQTANYCYVNVINGGTIRAAGFYRHPDSFGCGGSFDFSFNGGTLRCGSNNAELFAYWNKDYGYTHHRVDNVFIYKGGMTIDTDGRDVGTAQPLKKPEGKGVSAIPFDFSTFTAWNCPPMIKITGDGTGATAHALFDSASQMVTGVVITCAGTGYTTATATASYKGNGVPASQTVTCELADNDTTGRLVKTGEGTFTLNGVNAYAGATVARGGTLKVGVDDAISASSGIVLAGGDIDFNNRACTVKSITYGLGGGNILNAGSATLPSGYNIGITADEIMAGKAVVLPDGVTDLGSATVNITGDFSGLDHVKCSRYLFVTSESPLTGTPAINSPALPKGWRFSTTARGVRLVYSSGLSITVR